VAWPLFRLLKETEKDVTGIGVRGCNSKASGQIYGEASLGW